MKRILSLFIAFLLLSSVTYANPFSDVPKSHWAYEAVNKLSEKGLISGYPDGSFKGEKPVSRYAFAMVTAKILALVEQKSKDNSIEDLGDDDFETIKVLVLEFGEDMFLMGLRLKDIQSEFNNLKTETNNLKNDIKEIKQFSEEKNDKFNIYGDIVVRHVDAKEEHDWYDTKNSYAQTKLRLNFKAKIDENVTALARWRVFSFKGNAKNSANNYVYGSQLGGGVQADNEIDKAYLKIKDFLDLGGDLEIGRNFAGSGHALVMHSYVDAIKYTRRFGEINADFNMFYEMLEHGSGIKNDSSRPIWNINVKTKYKDNNLYLGLYSQNKGDYDNSAYIAAPEIPNIKENVQKHVVEIGSEGDVDNKGWLSYDFSTVYSLLKANEANDIKGWIGYFALKYDTKKSWAGKVSVAIADSKSEAAFAPVSYDRRITDSSESPFEDIAKGNSWFKYGIQNMKDIKLQTEYKPKNSRHYARIAYDFLSKYHESDYSDNFTKWAISRHDGYDIGNGVQNGNASVTTLEYRYKLAENTRLRLGYTGFKFDGKYESGVSTGANDASGNGLADYRIFWAEIYSQF